jgi:hypothetical protein
MREKLVKIGTKVVSHARHVTFQMPEVLVSRSLFHEILDKDSSSETCADWVRIMSGKFL